MAQNIYEMLRGFGVSAGSNPQDVEKAYRTFAKKYHPDLNPDITDDPTSKKIFSDVTKEMNSFRDNPDAYNRDKNIHRQRPNPQQPNPQPRDPTPHQTQRNPENTTRANSKSEGPQPRHGAGEWDTSEARKSAGQTDQKNRNNTWSNADSNPRPPNTTKAHPATSTGNGGGVVIIDPLEPINKVTNRTTPLTTTNTTASSRMNSGMAAYNTVQGVRGIADSIERGDTAGIVVHGAATLEGAAETSLGLMQATGKTVPAGVNTFASRAAIPVAIGMAAYEVYAEDGNLIDTDEIGVTSLGHKGERLVSSGAVLGSAIGTGAIVTSTLASTGTVIAGSAVATAAAPVVAAAAVAYGVAEVSNTVIETRRTYEETDNAFKANLDTLQNASKLKYLLGPELGNEIRKIPGTTLITDENGDESLQLENGTILKLGFDGSIINPEEIDLVDSRMFGAVNQALYSKMKEVNKLIEENESSIPRSLRSSGWYSGWLDGSTDINVYNQAMLDRQQLEAAAKELSSPALLSMRKSLHDQKQIYLAEQERKAEIEASRLANEALEKENARIENELKIAEQQKIELQAQAEELKKETSSFPETTATLQQSLKEQFTIAASATITAIATYLTTPAQPLASLPITPAPSTAQQKPAPAPLKTYDLAEQRVYETASQTGRFNMQHNPNDPLMVFSKIQSDQTFIMGNDDTAVLRSDSWKDGQRLNVENAGGKLMLSLNDDEHITSVQNNEKGGGVTLTLGSDNPRTIHITGNISAKDIDLVREKNIHLDVDGTGNGKAHIDNIVNLAEGADQKGIKLASEKGYLKDHYDPVAQNTLKSDPALQPAAPAAHFGISA